MSLTDALSRLLFLNEGHVSSSQRFALHTVTAVYNEEYSYNGDGGNRWLAYNKGLEYLFEQHADNSTATPPSGTRCAAHTAEVPVSSGRMWKIHPSSGSVTSSDSAEPSKEPAP